MEHEEQGYEISVLEPLHYALMQGNQPSWAEREQSLRGIVRGWLHAHPSREAACRCASEEYYVTLACERFRKDMTRGQVNCQTVAEAVVALRASLNGVILETLRLASRPEAVSKTVHGEPELAKDRKEVWDRVQSLLPDQREQRLAYLLYHCGLSPREIVRLCPQEWSGVQEISRLRRTLLDRLLPHVNQLLCTASQQANRC